MCQQHTRTYICGHHEALKPRYCPLVVQNAGQACSDADVIDRASPDLCASCQAEIAAATQQRTDSAIVGGPNALGVNGMALPTQMPQFQPQVPAMVGMQDIVMSGT